MPARPQRGGRLECEPDVRAERSLTILAFAVLAGCGGLAGRGDFRLTAEQVNRAWGAVMAREMRDAAAQGIDPLWDLRPPAFSGAACRWIEPHRRALCRYRVSRGFPRPGRERQWVDEKAELYLNETGWDFGY